jgi:2-methylcitrate dehydratase PrpD
MHETRTLARFVADTRFDDLPRGLVDNLKLTVLDTFAAAFVGSMQPWTQRILKVVRALGGPPDASVIGQDWRADVLAGRPREWRADRRLRVRGAHRLARQRHRVAGGAGRV